MTGPDWDALVVTAVGEELRRARGAAGLRQGEAADKIGIPRNTYSCYEQGIRPCSIPRLMQICQIFEADPGQLVNRASRRVYGTKTCPCCGASVREGEILWGQHEV